MLNIATHKNEYQKHLLFKIAQWMCLVTIFTLPLSPTILKFTLPASILFILFSGKWREVIFFLKDKIVQRFILFIIVLLIGIFWGYHSGITLKEGFNGFFKYTKFLYLPFCLVLFRRDASMRRFAENALVAGAIGASIICLMCMNFNSQESKIISDFLRSGSFTEGYLIYPINVSEITAFALFIVYCRIWNGIALCEVFCRSINKQKIKLILEILAFLFLIYCLFFVIAKRTGELIFISLIILHFWQKKGVKGVVIALIVIPFFVGGLLYISKNFEQKATAVIKEAKDYHKNKISSSIGDRMAFAEHCLKEIKKRPIMGFGTGSFRAIYSGSGGPMMLFGTKRTMPNDPHNEYLLIMIQAGIVGVITFLFPLISLWRTKTNEYNRILLKGLILSLAISCFPNSAVYIGVTGLFYILFIAVFLSAKYDD